MRHAADLLEVELVLVHDSSHHPADAWRRLSEQHHAVIVNRVLLLDPDPTARYRILNGAHFSSTLNIKLLRTQLFANYRCLDKEAFFAHAFLLAIGPGSLEHRCDDFAAFALNAFSQLNGVVDVFALHETADSGEFGRTDLLLGLASVDHWVLDFRYCLGVKDFRMRLILKNINLRLECIHFRCKWVLVYLYILQ